MTALHKYLTSIIIMQNFENLISLKDLLGFLIIVALYYCYVLSLNRLMAVSVSLTSIL